MPRRNAPLTLKWVEEAVPGHLFRPVVGNARDPFHLGWEPVKPVKKPALDLEFGSVPWASAEGVVGLASISETVRSTGFGVRLVGPTRDDSWCKALNLQQVIAGEWHDPQVTQNADVLRSRGDQLRRWVITGPEACLSAADSLQHRAAVLLGDHSSSSGVVTAVHLLVHQALLNVLEHAYGSGLPAVAFSAMTISQPLDWGGRRSPLTADELSWLKFSSGQILEVAIGDQGTGVPGTLWSAYSRRHPEAFQVIKGLSLGTNDGRAERARLQQEITRWALAHDSTRKLPSDFPDDERRLNWRGLHRAANCIADVDGCIAIRSGQARAGYVFREGRADPLNIPQRERHKEFPGTTLVIRVPIPAPTPRYIRITSTESTKRDLLFHSVVRSSVAKTQLPEIPGDVARVVAVCHPFLPADVDAGGRLLDLVRAVPPNYIQVHAYLAPLNESVLTQFHAFVDDQDYFLPRLICFWSGEHTLWKFAGRMPSAARAFIGKVERIETVPIPPELAEFAKELKRAYSPYVRIDEGVFRLEVGKQGLKESLIDQVLQSAFDEFVDGRGSKRWLTAQPGTLVRLRSGRLVRKYVSILELLNANDLLTRAVGRKLGTLLKRLQVQNPRVRVVTDSEASYFLARHLLGDQNIPIVMQPDNAAARIFGPTVGFFDATYRGETLRAFAARLEDRVGLICCVDLRKGVPDEPGVPKFETLLRFPFDPEEVKEKDVTSAEAIKELDQITLDPCDPVDPKKHALGTTDERTAFILEHAELMRYGIHVSAGRIHVVSLSVPEMVTFYANELIRWTVDELVEAAQRACGDASLREVVLFTRGDSLVRDLVGRIAELLEARLGAAVFASTIPTAPYKSREIFVRVDSEQDLLANVQRLGNQGSLVFEPPTQYVAILIEDAAVTGRGLLNFLIRLADARRVGQRPTAIVAIPVVSRLSPAEEHLYASLLKTLGPNAVAPMRFEFSPLFRLQVQSYDDSPATPAFRHLARIRRHEHSFGPRLSNYVAKIGARLNRAIQVAGGHHVPVEVCSHPFYSGDDNDTNACATVSARTVWIRQLIALYEQNVAVLGQLLHELRESCLGVDASLLTLFATEPSLLELRPFQRHCRQDLVGLALETVKNPATESSLKSDALVVLLGGNLPSPDEIAEIAAALEGDVVLLDQFLVMLLANDSPLDTGKVRVAIRRRVSDGDGLIKASLDAWEKIHVPHPISNLDDATRAVVFAVGRTIYHAAGDREFNAPTTRWMQMAPSEVRAEQPAEQINAILPPALQAVCEYFLPALDGLEYLARNQEHGQAARALAKAQANLTQFLSQLHESSFSLGNAPLGMEQTKRIEELWAQIKGCTQFGPPQTYLARTPMPGETVGVLEAWMPRFFCLPADVALELARSWPQVRVAANWQQEPMAVSAVLLRAPLADVREMFELLFSDAGRHGVGETRTDFILTLGASKSHLEVSVSNEVSPRRNPGTGRSRQLVRNIAARNQWDVVFPDSVDDAEPFRVRIVFSTVYEVQME